MGRFGKKRCNAPRATDFQEKRNPPQADSTIFNVLVLLRVRNSTGTPEGTE